MKPKTYTNLLGEKLYLVWNNKEVLDYLVSAKDKRSAISKVYTQNKKTGYDIQKNDLVAQPLHFTENGIALY